MNLDINTNGAWRTVLREIPEGSVETAKAAAHVLCVIGTHLRFRLTYDGRSAIAYCDRSGWKPAKGTA